MFDIVSYAPIITTVIAMTSSPLLLPTLQLCNIAFITITITGRTTFAVATTTAVNNDSSDKKDKKKQ